MPCESLSRQTVGDRHRLAQFGRPSRPGDTGLNKPAGGRQCLLASPVFGDRTDRQQHRQRLRAGPSLELRDEPADQRLRKTPHRHPRRSTSRSRPRVPRPAGPRTRSAPRPPRSSHRSAAAGRSPHPSTTGKRIHPARPTQRAAQAAGRISFSACPSGRGLPRPRPLMVVPWAWSGRITHRQGAGSLRGWLGRCRVGPGEPSALVLKGA